MKISGLGSSLPSKVVTNQMLAEILDTSDEWITTRTGIKERRVLSKEYVLDLAVDAALKAVADAKIDVKDLDFVICANVVNEYVTPALSCIIKEKIGAKCPCIDLNGACVGFIYACDMAEAYYKIGRVKNVLVVCAEAPAHMLDWHDRTCAVLFGAGAGAAVLTPGDNILTSRLTSSDGWDRLYEMHDLQWCPYDEKGRTNLPLVMHGQDVFKFATSTCVNDLQVVLKDAGLTADDIDTYFIHQANLRIIKYIEQMLKQPTEKFPTNIEKYGNTSSASLPILLDETKRAGKLKEGDILAFSAFGAGLVSGAMIMKW
ncbi:MAG: beta-ketoacyl-ACP synthase 3 [Bacteroidales bacterium]|jgi:3-oxoacyl-[acyl-carrier-protein] synthase-3|nr:beta-ketoacyl-ACP synthase 3 [Bacteroidales bacterium]